MRRIRARLAGPQGQAFATLISVQSETTRGATQVFSLVSLVIAACTFGLLTLPEMGRSMLRGVFDVWASWHFGLQYGLAMALAAVVTLVLLDAARRLFDRERMLT